jgi:hypothetical protein
LPLTIKCPQRESNKKVPKVILEFFYIKKIYKSEKSAGRALSVGVESMLTSFLVQKNLFDKSLIVEKITSGETYFDTFSPSMSQNFGVRNTDKIITINQITAYFMLFTAGFTLSSFPPDKINITHHQIMKKIATIQEKSIISEIATLIISSNSYTAVVSNHCAANTISTIFFKN